MMPSPTSPARAAQNVLERSLGLRRDQNLLVFVDPASLEIVEPITRAARALGVATSVMYVPYHLQSEHRANESLPLPVEMAIREADAVLSCLSGGPEYLPYRLKVLRTSWSRRTKMAHAPDMTLETLRLADTDYAQICERAHALARALILGREMIVYTRSQSGTEYQLAVQVGGWDNPPGISDGVISDGAWANLPPGETYVVPQDGEGQIVIDGSIPGRIMLPDEEFVLTFKNARAVSILPQTSPAVAHLYATQIGHAQSRGDQNWSNLAEVGFGLNPAVDQLTGVCLVDEKKADTVHIGLGHSASLGGRVESTIHCDMVTLRPTVKIDGRLILDEGRWCLEESDWNLDHRKLSVPPEWWASVGRIRGSVGRAEQDHERLNCRWNVGRGRWDMLSIGPDHTARCAARLYALLPGPGEHIGRDALVERAVQAGLNQAGVQALLWIMHQYDLVHLEGDSSS